MILVPLECFPSVRSSIHFSRLSMSEFMSALLGSLTAFRRYAASHSAPTSAFSWLKNDEL